MLLMFLRTLYTTLVTPYICIYIYTLSISHAMRASCRVHYAHAMLRCNMGEQGGRGEVLILHPTLKNPS